jgi:hypothetical protein
MTDRHTHAGAQQNPQHNWVEAALHLEMQVHMMTYRKQHTVKNKHYITPNFKACLPVNTELYKTQNAIYGHIRDKLRASTELYTIDTSGMLTNNMFTRSIMINRTRK